MAGPKGKGARRVGDAERAEAEEARQVKIAELRKQIAEEAGIVRCARGVVIIIIVIVFVAVVVSSSSP